MRILIIKHGALGDVIRTSYFAGALRRKYNIKLRLSWITDKSSLPLLRFNPHIDDIWTEFDSAQENHFNCVYSLDDERFSVEGVMKISTDCIVGAFIGDDGTITYSSDSSPWFDMGLLSKYGKDKADELKKTNIRGHSEIFSEIFKVDTVHPEFWGIERLIRMSKNEIDGDGVTIGINPWAGGRWPSKELQMEELLKLCIQLLSESKIISTGGKLVLLGAGSDRVRNAQVANKLNNRHIYVANTDESLLKFAGTIKSLDYLVTSDSLALHFAVSQGVKFLAFFSPTSSAEIDTFGIGSKIESLSDDYCSYRADADNKTITADRLLSAIREHNQDLFL